MTESSKKKGTIAQQLALLDSDPAAGILAVADRYEAAIEWAQRNEPNREHADYLLNFVRATARRWRGVTERHRRERGPFDRALCSTCGELGGSPTPYHWQRAAWPCPDLTETVDEVRAYLGRP